MPSAAKIIADSISATTGERLTTMEVVTHRFVLAEFNTHRVFSRNSASSRAIPVAKMLERVIADPALPLSWPREQSGMQGGDELSPAERADAEEWWLGARDLALDSAKGLVALGVHKSVVNRLLEPFLWHTIIVSSTEWENFFAQRCSPLAQPEIRVTAELMREALDNSEPVKLAPGDWHLPYITAEDLEACMLVGADPRQVSVARCARVSYLTHDGVRNPKVDVGLYIKLCSADPPHWSPLEHVATPTIAGIETPGNFTGWDQLRHYIYNGSN